MGDRLVLLRALTPAGIPLVGALSLVLVPHATVPAAMALALGLIVDRLSGATGSSLFTAAIVPLAVFGAVVLLGHITEAAAKPLEFATRARIDGRHRTRILELTTSVRSIGPLEDGEIQQLIRQTGAEPDYGVTTPADGALAQLRWFAGLIGAAMACAVLARYHWWLIPVLLVPSAIGLYLRSRQYFAAVQALQVAMREELFADVWRQAAASSADGKDVRIFGFAGWMVERMQRHIEAGNAPFWEHINRVSKASWIQFSLALLGLAPAYVFVTVDAVGGRTSVAVQTAVLVAGWSLFGALGTSTGIYQMAGSAQVMRAFDSLSGELDRQPRQDGGGWRGAQALPMVRLEAVSFRYPRTEADVLNGLNLEIRPSELLAIVGLNGAGKSTLIKLLAGLYAPDSGRITIDGTDLADFGVEAWRRQISVVFQDFVRYELPAIDNVTLGQAHVPADEAIAERAAQRAGFDEVLRRLPDGWRTPLSRGRSGGVDLSGGQWQQVVLARALYAVQQGARLLVLDEPTAHLDVRTEFKVFNRLTRERGDISVVLISHRLSTVRQADRIVLLDGGRITESGTHDELMALGGGYAKMFMLQSERFHQEAAEAEEVAL